MTIKQGDCNDNVNLCEIVQKLGAIGDISGDMTTKQVDHRDNLRGKSY